MGGDFFLIDTAKIKLGKIVRVCSQKGKCRLIAPIEEIDWNMRTVIVHNFMNVKQSIPFDRLKEL